LFNASDVSLKVLIEMAFGVDDGQIVKAPSWLDSELYDVSARSSNNVSLSREALKQPLQQLLRERFHLQAHRQDVIVSGYALTIAKGGCKMQPKEGSFQYAYFFSEALIAKGVSAKTFAALLSRPLGRPVEDQTGLQGIYNVELHYATVDDTDSPLPSLPTALRDTLGLEVKPAKVSTTLLVIDHVDKEPTGN
jgi:uncharacterized protein (TIGR03435 family)